MDDLVKVVAFVVVLLCLGYVLINISSTSTAVATSKREGLENASSSTANGEAGTAASYSAAIKAKTVQLQDALLISKYKQDYENIIINLDDYINMMMLKQLLNMNVSGTDVARQLGALNALHSSKLALNETMKFLDGYKG